MTHEGILIGVTESVCPVCLERISAKKTRYDNDIYMIKTCKKHGSFRTILWRGKPDYEEWHVVKPPEYPGVTHTETDRGCPSDCGLCPSHRQQSCCVLIEVTERCNLKCPFCFADAGKVEGDPSLTEIKEILQNLWDTAGACNIQLSGGEPTVRDDLHEIIRMARSIGFSFIQLNTNGLRLASDAEYAGKLREAGLSTVFLQFDGTSDEINEKIRGRSLLTDKIRAIDNCGSNGLGVVLVPTLIPGINVENIGDMIWFAAERQPTVRGIHFQPVSYFGRYPSIPDDSERITMPEVMTAIEKQTAGLIKAENLVPSGCENTLCSFHGDFLISEGAKPVPLSANRKLSAGCCGTADRKDAVQTVIQARNFVVRRWAMLNKTDDTSDQNPSGWDRILEQLRSNRFSITCMAFQDAWNLDIERLKECNVHVAGKERVIPFCSYNLTDADGKSLHRAAGRLAL